MCVDLFHLEIHSIIVTEKGFILLSQFHSSDKDPGPLMAPAHRS